MDQTQYEGAYFIGASFWLNMTAPGTQTCATGDSLTVTMSSSTNSAWAGTYTATACSVQVDYMSAFGGMGGKILSATLTNGNSKTITLSNAEFRVYQHYGKTGTAPTLASDTSVHVTVVIDSGSFELPGGRYFRLDSTVHTATSPGSSFGFSVPANDGSKGYITVFFQSLSNQVGTYHCGDVFSGGTTNIQLWLGNYGFEQAYVYKLNGNVAGSCTVNVTTAPTNNSSRGNYQATLVYLDPNATYQSLLTAAQRTITIHGEFRH
ncbi:MAG TPA: hypothetical protein DCQ83_09060 [Fibrobacteres bacterium]|nr:hypothetical protein [Fibrobacterota bacterium]